MEYNMTIKITQSSAISVVLEFLSDKELLKLQIVNKKFYYRTIPMMMQSSYITLGHNTVYVKFGKNRLITYCIPTRQVGLKILPAIEGEFNIHPSS